MIQSQNLWMVSFQDTGPWTYKVKCNFQILLSKTNISEHIIGKWLHADIWLVISTHLKNISQIGTLPQIGVKIKNTSNHLLDMRLLRKICDSRFTLGTLGRLARTMDGSCTCGYLPGRGRPPKKGLPLINWWGNDWKSVQYRAPYQWNVKSTIMISWEKSKVAASTLVICRISQKQASITARSSAISTMQRIRR